MRSISALFLLGLSLAVACDGSTGECGSCDNSQAVRGEDDTAACCGTDDTGGDPPAMGSFTAPAVDVIGTDESCTSNLLSVNDDYTVATGETKEVKAGSYDLTYGDMSLATEYSDMLPIHTGKDSSTWIAPAETVKVEDGKVATADPPVMTRYVGGQTWTCNLAGSTDESTAQAATVSYLDDPSGLMVSLPSLGNVHISGEDLWLSDGECNDSGEISDSEATFHVECSFGYLDYECWQGEFEDKPDTW